FLAQLVDVLAALADHHPRAGRVDGHARDLGRTLDQDLADAGLGQLLAQHLADLEVGGEIFGVFLLVGVPLGVPILGKTEAIAGGMNLVTHSCLPFPVASSTTTVMWLVRLRMRVPRPLARALNRFRVGPSSTMMVVTYSSSTSAPWLFSALAIADSTTLRI